MCFPFSDGEESEIQFGMDVLLPAAEEYFTEEPEGNGFSLAFFVAAEVKPTFLLQL